MPDGGTLTIDTANASSEPGTIRPGDDRRRRLHRGLRQRHRGGHVAGHAREGVRAVLHDQADRPGHRPRAVDDLWLRQAVARSCPGRQHRGNVGTTFRLYVPNHKGTVETRAIAPPRDAAIGAGETVLVVEDDSAVRLIISDVLRDLGYASVEAGDGQAALPMLTSNTALDLLITDVGLPGLNGRQVAEIARQHRPDLKILFVTGYAEHATGHAPFLAPRHGDGDQAVRARRARAQDPRDAREKIASVTPRTCWR